MVDFTNAFCKYLTILESTRQLFVFFNLEYEILCDSAFVVSGAEILNENLQGPYHVGSPMP